MKTIILSLFLSVITMAVNRPLDDLAVRSGKYLLVSKPIEVPAGDTLTIRKGSEVLFSPFAGIILTGGVFLADGTKDSPISLTSVQDTVETTSSFDWNGIEIKKGTAHLSYCFIANSTAGITAIDSQSVFLDNCIFGYNGQWHLSIAGSIVPVPDMKPFSYVFIPSLIVTPILVPKVPAAQKPSFIHHYRYYFVAAGIISVIGGSYYLLRANSTLSDYNAYMPGNSSFDQALPEQRQHNFDSLRAKYHKESFLGFSLVALSAIDAGLLVFKWRF